MTRRALLTTGSNMLEYVERNSFALPPDRRSHWQGEMTRGPRQAEIVGPPERLILELANTCNLDCPMCRIGEFGVNAERFMPRETFDRVADELFPLVREVRLNGLGEATLVPWFDQCIERVQQARLRGELITNLTFSQDLMAKLIAARFTVLVSWDAATPQLFETLRRPARWSDQRARLELLGRLAAESNVAHQIHLLFTLQRANTAELPGIVRLAAEVGVKNVLVNVVKLQNERWVNNARIEVLRSIDEARTVATGLGVKLALPDHIGSEPIHGEGVMQTSAGGCDRPHKEMVVRWNGDVTVCNMFNPYAYGHLERHGFERVWNGSLAQAFRRLVNSSAKHPYCEGCYYVHGVFDQAGRIR